MPINLVITNAGRAALVNAAHTGTLPVTITQIGLASLYTAPAQTLAALPSELKRLNAIAGQAVADNTLHVSMKDESADAYSLRTIGLYLGNGTLFACAGQPEAILNKASSAVALAAFDIAFDDIDSASIAFGSTDFIMPAATTEAQGVVELATVAEAQNGSDPARALTPFTARAALFSWLLGLDGAGSGLDADLLDGQHGSWYADIPARLGYVPLNAAQFTAVNLRTMLIGVDGTTSGLDADLLDGQHGAWYADIAARLGFAPLPATDYTAADVVAKLLGLDGAGSGIDADMLDGHQGASYRRVVSSNITDNGGFVVYSDGLKECWGFVDCPANSSATFNLPVPHTGWIVPVLGVRVGVGNATQQENTGIGGITIGNPSSIQLYSAENFSVRIYVHTKGV